MDKILGMRPETKEKLTGAMAQATEVLDNVNKDPEPIDVFAAQHWATPKPNG